MSRSPPDRRGALERGPNSFLARQNGSGCGQWATSAQTEAAECGLPRKRRCGGDVRQIRARAPGALASGRAGGGSRVPMGPRRGPELAALPARGPGPIRVGPARCCGGIMTWTPAQGAEGGRKRHRPLAGRRPGAEQPEVRPAGTVSEGRSNGRKRQPRPPAGQQRLRQGRPGGR
jgi:hypothetical protein